MKNKLLLLIAAIGLMSCGGGGGGGGTPVATGETINGIAVPPAPPAATATSTTAGVDTNSNGVRDDVERTLAQSQGANAPAFTSSMVAATQIQAVMANPAGAPISADAIVEHQAKLVCGDAAEKQSAIAAEEATLNTRDRQRQMIEAYLAARSSSTYATGQGVTNDNLVIICQ
jgi:hypothetical protein